MRRHGWGGNMPVDDDDAVARILATAKALIAEDPVAAPSMAEVADRLSITRQTVYRYYPSAQDLLVAAVSGGVEEFLDDIAAHLADQRTPAEAVIEGIAFTYEQIQQRPDLSLLLAVAGGSKDVTSETSVQLGRSILERLPVDWTKAGYDDAELDGLVELMLRTLQSFIIDPGNSARSPASLRAYLRRWVGPTVSRPPSCP